MKINLKKFEEPETVNLEKFRSYLSGQDESSPKLPSIITQQPEIAGFAIENILNFIFAGYEHYPQVPYKTTTLSTSEYTESNRNSYLGQMEKLKKIDSFINLTPEPSPENRKRIVDGTLGPDTIDANLVSSLKNINKRSPRIDRSNRMIDQKQPPEDQGRVNSGLTCDLDPLLNLQTKSSTGYSKSGIKKKLGSDSYLQDKNKQHTGNNRALFENVTPSPTLATMNGGAKGASGRKKLNKLTQQKKPLKFGSSCEKATNEHAGIQEPKDTSLENLAENGKQGVQVNFAEGHNEENSKTNLREIYKAVNLTGKNTVNKTADVRPSPSIRNFSGNVSKINSAEKSSGQKYRDNYLGQKNAKGQKNDPRARQIAFSNAKTSTYFDDKSPKALPKKFTTNTDLTHTHSNIPPNHKPYFMKNTNEFTTRVSPRKKKASLSYYYSLRQIKPDATQPLPHTPIKPSPSP